MASHLRPEGLHHLLVVSGRPRASGAHLDSLQGHPLVGSVSKVLRHPQAQHHKPYRRLLASRPRGSLAVSRSNLGSSRHKGFLERPAHLRPSGRESLLPAPSYHPVPPNLPRLQDNPPPQGNKQVFQNSWG